MFQCCHMTVSQSDGKFIASEYFKCSSSLVVAVCIAWINDCTLYFCWFTWAKLYTLHWEQFYVKHDFAHLCFHLQTHINPMIDLFWMILCEQMCRHHIQYCNTWCRVPHLWCTHMYECAIISMSLMRLQTLVRCCSICLAPKSHDVLTSLSLSFHFTLLASLPSLPYCCKMLTALCWPLWLHFISFCFSLHSVCLSAFTLLVHDYVSHTLPAE